MSGRNRAIEFFYDSCVGDFTVHSCRTDSSSVTGSTRTEEAGIPIPCLT